MSVREDAPLPGDVQEMNFEPDENKPRQPAGRSGGDRLPPADYGTTSGSDRSAPPDTESPAAIAPSPQSAASSSSSSSVRALAPELLRGVLMALVASDHVVIGLQSWTHGLRQGDENDSTVVRRWLPRLAFNLRMLVHLCAPGFALLLGLGIVYFGASRIKLGWSAGRMARHFFMRALALSAVSELLGLFFYGGQVWIFNTVLISLGIGYLLAGLLWLAIGPSERALARLIVNLVPKREENRVTEPLLQSPLGEVQRHSDTVIMRAANTSWHLHNVFLLGLTAVTIGWNVWLSPTRGHCLPEGEGEHPPPPTDGGNWLFNVLFYNVETYRVISPYPPLAWISFTFLGLLYGRILLARSWTARRVAQGNFLASLAFALLFVLTRLLRFGNLSEDCLRAPEHTAGDNNSSSSSSSSNPYLASAASFFYVVKYPPDVALFAFSSSGNFLLLSAFALIPVRFSKQLSVPLSYGTSALFFFFMHHFVVFAVAVVMLALFGRKREPGPHDLPFVGPASLPGPVPFLCGWVASLALLYPLCRWYSRFKATRGVDSLWRFF